MNGPREEITRRLEARRAAVARLDRADARIAWGRLAIFAAGAALAWLAWGQHRLSAGWLLGPLAAFVALAVVHDRVLSARARARRAVAFHTAALARMDGTFAGAGAGGERFADPAHPYALDLDLFGRGSLFELLCAARTRPGEERLAAWLLHPAPAAEGRARQRAIASLAPRLDLREDLAVLGEDVRAGVDAAGLAAWGEAAPLLPAFVRPAALALAALAVAAAVAWGVGLGPAPLLLVLLGEWAFSRVLRGRMAHVLGGVEHPAAELRVLALLLERLEAEPLDGDARLGALQASLRGAGAPASVRIAALVRVVARMEWGRNQFFAPLAFALAWGPLHAAAVERWRAASGRGIRRWLEAVAELEALSSLAGYAYEHPGDAWPELLDGGPGRGPILEAEGLRHPLLPGAVPNDLRLGGEGPRVLLVSGSNMSGKSTYLRTAGVNVVLALAGAPVRAARMRLTPVQAGATLRIQDSLQAGKSRFYAEITRLKELADLAAGPFPLLFLLDEILHGTNSHDRRIGAEAIVRGLLDRGALGLVTTHDLALTELGGSDGVLANGHFEDQVKDGEIAFDYRLRPGVVAHSNALALMRAVGLRV
ncbi:MULTISPECIES: DNA mismatch repair protein MutS [Anaeromyxobacter]|uniref:MutS-related protein n=1 Tax=Anaeromyxobacter TaxID=161492 RepID=UPI001F5638F3|nr:MULTISPECIES: DNA mismatch repair protein MutS [unclassified Anaeromyxobacter]